MFSEKLKQFKTNAKPEIIEAIQKAGTEDNLRKVIAKYHVHIDVAEETFSALMLMCYGAMSSSDCFNEIHKIGAVAETDFVNFIQDINSQILNPIQNEIKNAVSRDAEQREANYTKELNNQSVSNSENIEDFFKSLGLNPDGSSKESVEDTLARINKKVDDEIDAEIEAELAEEAKKAQEVKPENKPVAQNIPTPKEAQISSNVLDLDNIPKTEVQTHNFVEQPKTEEVAPVPKTEMVEPDLASNEAIVNIDAVKNNSLDFIESRATGNIKLEPTTKSDLVKPYYKDPYHEEL